MNRRVGGKKVEIGGSEWNIKEVCCRCYDGGGRVEQGIGG